MKSLMIVALVLVALPAALAAVLITPATAASAPTSPPPASSPALTVVGEMTEQGHCFEVPASTTRSADDKTTEQPANIACTAPGVDITAHPYGVNHGITLMMVDGDASIPADWAPAMPLPAAESR